jgi:hypothetical protein
MYTGKKEHNPPHIHAIYQGQKAMFDIRTGEKMEGSIPGDQVKMVMAWIVMHRDELLADWDLAQNDENVYKIDPLR